MRPLKSLCQPERWAFERQLDRVLGIINHKLHPHRPVQVPDVDRNHPRRIN